MHVTWSVILQYTHPCIWFYTLVRIFKAYIQIYAIEYSIVLQTFCTVTFSYIYRDDSCHTQPNMKLPLLHAHDNFWHGKEWCRISDSACIHALMQELYYTCSSGCEPSTVRCQTKRLAGCGTNRHDICNWMWACNLMYTSSCHSTYCISGNNLLTQSARTHTPKFTSTWTSSSCTIWLHVSIAWTTCMPRQVYRCCYFITSPADMQRSTNALYVKLVDALKMPVSSRSVWVYYNHTFIMDTSLYNLTFGDR